MRTDTTIDNRAIPCPNASYIAGGLGAAKAGHMITCTHGGAQRMARVLGRVSAPAIGDDSTPVKGWALVLMLSEDGSFGYERWIDPADITRVYESPAAFAAFFFAPKLPYDVHTVRRLMEHGSLSDRYVGGADAVVAGWTK